jgi:hypothetical protein
LEGEIEELPPKLNVILIGLFLKQLNNKILLDVERLAELNYDIRG